MVGIGPGIVPGVINEPPADVAGVLVAEAAAVKPSPDAVRDRLSTW
jgi:hypothetical protein